MMLTVFFALKARLLSRREVDIRAYGGAVKRHLNGGIRLALFLHLGRMVIFWYDKQVGMIGGRGMIRDVCEIKL